MPSVDAGGDSGRHTACACYEDSGRHTACACYIERLPVNGYSGEPVAEMRQTGGTYCGSPSRFFPAGPFWGGARRSPRPALAGANYWWIISKAKLPVLRV